MRDLLQAGFKQFHSSPPQCSAARGMHNKPCSTCTACRNSARSSVLHTEPLYYSMIQLLQVGSTHCMADKVTSHYQSPQPAAHLCNGAPDAAASCQTLAPEELHKQQRWHGSSCHSRSQRSRSGTRQSVPVTAQTITHPLRSPHLQSANFFEIRTCSGAPRDATPMTPSDFGPSALNFATAYLTRT